MEIGIVGLPASGKSTVFNALTGAKATTGSYSGREQPNIAVVQVPDARIDTLVPMFKPKKTIYATVAFADIGGIKGSAGSPGDGFSPALLASARQVDTLAFVIGLYSGDSDPSAEVEEIELELSFADLAIIERRLERLDSDIKKSSTAARAAFEAERELLARLKSGLEQDTPIRNTELSTDEEKSIRGYGFLTAKPAFVILNVAEEDLRRPIPDYGLGLPCVAISGDIEAEIAELESEDARTFLADLGVEEPGINRVIQLAYRTAQLVSFFTVGPDEVRAWTIPEGSTAVAAAGAIHTDIARGLIRAEVVDYDDLIRAGGLVEARRLGLLRLEGKTYPVKDGDVCNFLSNV